MTDSNDSALDGAGKVGHTPGPWFCEYGTDGYYGLYHNGDEALDENVPENERLIAAAPDLLEACLWLEEYAKAQVRVHPQAEDSDGWRILLSAIAKATGAAS